MPAPELPPTSVELAQKPPSLRLILNGQGRGAAMLFDKLSENHAIVGAICTNKEDDPLRIKINEYNEKHPESPIPIIDLGKVNTKNAQQQMKDMQANLGVGFFLQKEIKPETFSIPEYGTTNIHYSLLPKRQGRNAMERAVMEGDETLGATVFLMTRRVDAGPIVNQMSYENPGDKSQGRLYNEHLEEYVDLTVRSVDKLAFAIDARKKADGKKPALPVTPQIPSEMEYQEPLTEDDLFVDFAQMPAKTARNYMNAGGPGATTVIDGERYKISKPSIIDDEAGVNDGITVKAADGKILHIGKVEKIV